MGHAPLQFRNGTSFDVAVVGAGVNGLAAARALAGSGLTVGLFEQFNMGHVRGSSHGDSRTFRSYSDPSYLARWQEAKRGWRDLGVETGIDVLDPVGLLCYGAGGGVNVRSEAEALRRLDVPVEAIRPDEAFDRFRVRLPEVGDITYDATSGVILAERARRALELSCRSRGVAIVEMTRVQSITLTEGAVLLETTDSGVCEAAMVVVTAGAWARDLLAPLGIDLPVTMTSETVAYFPLSTDKRLPVLIDFSSAGVENGQGLYSLPSPSYGLKVAAHHSGPQIARPEELRGPDSDLVDRMTAWVARIFPTARAEPSRSETCLYTTAPREEFLLFRRERLVVGSACSGHGFKFAPATATHLVQLAYEVLA